MVIYEITATGSLGYQVTAISDDWQGAIVGDFGTLAEVESFAEGMREIDVGCTTRIEPR